MTSFLLSVLAAAPAGMPADVGSGVIHGGWSYVWAAYAIFWTGIVLYALSLFIRTRAANLDKEQV